MSLGWTLPAGIRRWVTSSRCIRISLTTTDEELVFHAKTEISCPIPTFLRDLEGRSGLLK